jgi:predicted AAA+ superfamily ATPase
MNEELLKQVIADNQTEIPNYKIISRNFVFEEFGNYVFVGIRRAGKSFLLYQRIRQLLEQGICENTDEMTPSIFTTRDLK